MTVRNAYIGLLSGLHAVACFDLWTRFTHAPVESSSDGLLFILAVVLQASSALYLAVNLRSTSPPDPPVGRLARLSAYVFVAVLLLTSALAGVSILSRSMARVFFLITLAAGWTFSCVVASRPAGPKRFQRTFDILTANVVIGILLLESGLLVISHVYPSRLFFDPTSAASTIDVWRIRPHATGFGFRYSSMGYHDEEFFVASDGDLVVALLADSFGVGVVPYGYNFATVAEERLRSSLAGSHNRVAVHNFGIPAAGMREYLHLLEEEVFQYKPDRVVVCVFVGNDIDGIENPSRRQRYLLQDWLFSTYLARARSVYRNLRAEGRGLSELAEFVGMKALGGTVANEEGGDTVDTETDTPEYVHDWRKEKPHLDRVTFLRWETRRLPVCNTRSTETTAKYEDFFDALARFDRKLGDRLLVLLIPDQFQIEDDLWQELLRDLDHPENYERDYPQQQIREYCDQHGIDYLDTLPLLRNEQRSGRTYHLQDTHWNARGNRIAGEALAKRLLADLGEE